MKNNLRNNVAEAKGWGGRGIVTEKIEEMFSLAFCERC